MSPAPSLSAHKCPLALREVPAPSTRGSFTRIWVVSGQSTLSSALPGPFCRQIGPWRLLRRFVKGGLASRWGMLVPGHEPLSCQLFPREPLEGGSDPPQSRRRGSGRIQLGETDELGQPRPGGCERAGRGLRCHPRLPQDSRPTGALSQGSRICPGNIYWNISHGIELPLSRPPTFYTFPFWIPSVSPL